MDWPKFLKFKGLLDYYGVKPLIGVIPDNQDPMLKDFHERSHKEAISDTESEENKEPADFWAYVKELQKNGWKIALHGLNHVYTTKKGGIFPLNDFSEFAGLPYVEQLELLSYAVDIFNEQEIETDIFMAPAHSYDLNTIKALKLLGFTKITDGFGDAPYHYKDMDFYPISFKRSSTLKKADGYSTFVYHTNTMNDRDFEAFEALLKGSGNSYEIIDYEEYLSAPVESRGAAGAIKERALALFKRTLVKVHS